MNGFIVYLFFSMCKILKLHLKAFGGKYSCYPFRARLKPRPTVIITKTKNTTRIRLLCLNLEYLIDGL